jgi:hypothetical protein
VISLAPPDPHSDEREGKKDQSGDHESQGAEVESPIGYVVEYKNAKAIRIDDFFDSEEALEAAGPSE